MSLETFNEKVLPLKDKLYRFSLSIVNNTHEAEDIIQEIMIKVWDKRAEWDSWSSIEAMCMTMTRNLSIDHTRGKHKRLTSFPENYDEPDRETAPDQQASSRDMMRFIQKIMDKMPELQKQIIQLREIEGYSYKEIAEILEVSMSQVKINVHRARLFLKNELMKSAEYGNR